MSAPRILLIDDASGDAPLPEDLLRSLQPNVSTPTFGKWCGILAALEAECRARGGLRTCFVRHCRDPGRGLGGMPCPP